jgi:hypothetical protein
VGLWRLGNDLPVRFIGLMQYQAHCSACLTSSRAERCEYGGVVDLSDLLDDLV